MDEKSYNTQILTIKRFNLHRKAEDKKLSSICSWNQTRFFFFLYKQKRATTKARKKRPPIDTPTAKIVVVCFPPPPGGGGATLILLLDGGGGKVVEGIVGVGSGVNAGGGESEGTLPPSEGSDEGANIGDECEFCGAIEDGVLGEEAGDCDAFGGE